jgi:hypothetical protein
MRAYYAYPIQDRSDEDYTLLKGGDLFQQFLVDAFINVEEDHVDYIRMNQNSLRTKLYKESMMQSYEAILSVQMLEKSLLHRHL